MKRFTALLFALLMIVSLFSACTDEKTESTTTKVNETTAETATTKANVTPTQTTTDTATTSATPSDLPDAVPADLKDVAALNSFATNLYIKYVKPNIFTAPASLFSAAEKDDARKALALVIDAETKAIAMYDKNEAFYFLRGKAYEQSFYDTKDAAFKEKGLVDLQKALDMGLAMAKTNFDALTAAK